MRQSNHIISNPIHLKGITYLQEIVDMCIVIIRMAYGLNGRLNHDDDDWFNLKVILLS